MSSGGTYPDLAMMKGLELAKLNDEYQVRSSTSRDIDELNPWEHVCICQHGCYEGIV